MRKASRLVGSNSEKKGGVRKEKSPHIRAGCTFDGADDGVRTRDPDLGKVVLYQLSHVRVKSPAELGFGLLVSEAGFEPAHPVNGH